MGYEIEDDNAKDDSDLHTKQEHFKLNPFLVRSLVSYYAIEELVDHNDTFEKDEEVLDSFEDLIEPNHTF